MLAPGFVSRLFLRLSAEMYEESLARIQPYGKVRVSVSLPIASLVRISRVLLCGLVKPTNVQLSTKALEGPHRMALEAQCSSW